MQNSMGRMPNARASFFHAVTEPPRYSVERNSKCSLAIVLNGLSSRTWCLNQPKLKGTMDRLLPVTVLKRGR